MAINPENGLELYLNPTYKLAYQKFNITLKIKAENAVVSKVKARISEFLEWIH